MSRNAFSLKRRLLKPAMATKSGAALAALICSTSLMTSQASAQLLDLCTGLRANVPVLQPVAGGFLDPLLNGLVSDINTNLLGALSGQTLGISAFDQNGNLISLPGNCRVAVDDVTVNANRGISMGGGQIDGLGGPGNAPAIAGEVNSIALGNGAVTSAGALNSIAIGLRGSVTAVDGVSLGRDTLVSSTGGVALGAGSLALRGGLSGGNEAFSGTAVASTAGAISIGSAGNERQITNVAGGTQDTDAVNIRQLRAVGNNVATSLGGGATFNVSTGGYTGPTYLVGGVAYYDVATAIAAVQTPGGPGFYAPVAGNNTSGYAGPVAAGSDALAVGYGASAGGSRSTALGANANSAGNNSVALGADSVASGTGSIAVGQGASANHVNATAIGNGATTTRANQVAVGNAQSTHTMAGVASAQSVAAQRGTTHLLTTDSAGNIATSNIDINAMDRRLTSLQAETQMNRREARQGIAAAMAMDTAPMPSAPGRTSWAMNTSTFKGEFAGGFSFAHRLNTARPFAITGSYGNSGGNTHGGRVGLAGEF